MTERGAASLAELYYVILFALSFACTVTYACIWHKHFDVYFTLMFTLIPIALMGYVMMARATTLETALAANKIIYVGGCYELLFVTLSVFSLCRIHLNRMIHALLMLVTTGVYLSSITVGESTVFYRSQSFEIVDGNAVLHKEYGPMHTVFIIMVWGFFLMNLGALIYSYFKKKDVSNRMIALLFLPELLAVFSYFGSKVLPINVELTPLSYVMAQCMYLIIIRRITLFDIDDTVIDSLVQTGNTGFASFDFKLRYIGSNETARRMLPVLKEASVDRLPEKNAQLSDTVLKWLGDFKGDHQKSQVRYESDGHIYMIHVQFLYTGMKRRGYQLVMNDDTENQRYISLMGRFNTELQSRVAQQTAHMREMHDHLILSMAAMVESRDNSTGGHIKRTSAAVRILIDEMKKDGSLGLTESFCERMIKAAPMHDLGKIAVDDAVLRKPGRFTPEEFEKMKAHAAEGARIVHQILEGTDDDEFHIIAENVAHFHHERWDGSGYPMGLKGEQIPLEARIMAIADVYDALVSRRVYKDSMSFEQADKIIMEGMGKHFDKRLEPFYVAARPRLEEFYRAQPEQ